MFLESNGRLIKEQPANSPSTLYISNMAVEVRRGNITFGSVPEALFTVFWPLNAPVCYFILSLLVLFLAGHVTAAVRLIRSPSRVHFSFFLLSSHRCAVLTLKLSVEPGSSGAWVDAAGCCGRQRRSSAPRPAPPAPPAPPAAAAPPRRSVPARQRRTQLPHISKKKNSGKIGRYLLSHPVVLCLI